MSEPAGLEVRDLHVSYGPIAAVRGVDLDVAPGEVVALIGANGAGKTSLLRALSRLAPSRGSAVLRAGGDRADLLTLDAPRVPSLGVGHVPEGRGIFPNLSVHENLKLGAYLRRDHRAIRDDLELRLDQFPRLRPRLGLPALTLSGGEQQMLAIARALMGRPRLLLLDEPSLGLAPKLVREVFDAIARLNAEGMTVLLVEQNARMALRVASRAYVLETGKVALSGTSAELSENASVRAAYLGS